MKAKLAVTFLLGGVVLAGCVDKDASGAEQSLIEAFENAHKVILPPELESISSGIYSGVEVQTPTGPEICKVSITQDISYARTRHIVLSDCQPK